MSRLLQWVDDTDSIRHGVAVYDVGGESWWMVQAVTVDSEAR